MEKILGILILIKHFWAAASAIITLHYIASVSRNNFNLNWYCIMRRVYNTVESLTWSLACGVIICPNYKRSNNSWEKWYLASYLAILVEFYYLLQEKKLESLPSPYIEMGSFLSENYHLITSSYILWWALFQKRMQTERETWGGGGLSVEDIEFPGVGWRKSMWKNQGSSDIEVEFPGVIKKKQFPWLVFGLRIIKGVASSQEAQFPEQKFPIF